MLLLSNMMICLCLDITDGIGKNGCSIKMECCELGLKILFYINLLNELTTKKF